MEKITVVKIGGNVIDDPGGPARLPRGLRLAARGEDPRPRRRQARHAPRPETRTAGADGRRAPHHRQGHARHRDDGLRRAGQQTARRPGSRRPDAMHSGCRAPTATPSWRAAAHPNRSTTASWATSKVSTTRCSGNFSGQASRPYSAPSCTTGRARCSTATPTAWLRPWHSAPPGSPPRSWSSASKKTACCTTRTTRRRSSAKSRPSRTPRSKPGGIVSKGMIPKVENALKAVANGVRSVTIKHSENLLNDTGTVIR